MRMATITLPMFDNNGAAIPAVHDALKDKLLDAFGGYSRSELDGAWREPSTGRVYTDHNAVYAIAMDDTPSNRQTVRNLARLAGVVAGQLSMMVTMPDGDVEFLDVDNTPVRRAA